jgi:hypothetical protein
VAEDVVFHLSEEPNIGRFYPRPAPSTNPGAPTGEMVWAVDRERLPNYLVPRDCPRVTFYVKADTTPEDAARLMLGTSARRVVAIETGWLERLRNCRLYRYELPGATFEQLGEGTGHHISRESVTPIRVVPIPDLLAELTGHDVELRVMPSLWKLRDAVIASTIQFSIIRWRNARPRPASDGAAPPA